MLQTINKGQWSSSPLALFEEISTNSHRLTSCCTICNRHGSSRRPFRTACQLSWYGILSCTLARRTDFCELRQNNTFNAFFFCRKYFFRYRHNRRSKKKKIEDYSLLRYLFSFSYGASARFRVMASRAFFLHAPLSLAAALKFVIRSRLAASSDSSW
jgi:hypothetical protein